MVEFFSNVFSILESTFMPSNPNGPLVLFLLAAITDIGIPVPFVLDSILILSAYRVMTAPHASWVPVVVIVIALFLGRQLGSGILYLLSRFLGVAFINWLKCHLPRIGNRMDALKNRLNHWAPLAIITGRLTPGLLQVTSVACGAVRLRYDYFAIGVALASLVYDGVLILLGFIASHSPLGTDINFTAWLLISMVVIVGILWPVIFVTARRRSKKESLLVANETCNPKIDKRTPN
jgi:membrane protein DedA with SNARE-associated domain